MAAPPARRGVRRVQALTPIAVTAGEPAGIGPDLCLALAQLAQNGELGSSTAQSLTIIGNHALLAERALLLGLDLELRAYSRGDADGVRVLDIPLAAPCVAGRLDPANARARSFYERLGFHELPSSRADAPLLGIATR